MGQGSMRLLVSDVSHEDHPFSMALRGLAQKAEACPARSCCHIRGGPSKQVCVSLRSLIGWQRGLCWPGTLRPGGSLGLSPSSHVHGLASSAYPGPLGGACISRIKQHVLCPQLFSSPLTPKERLISICPFFLGLSSAPRHISPCPHHQGAEGSLQSL